LTLSRGAASQQLRFGYVYNLKYDGGFAFGFTAEKISFALPQPKRMIRELTSEGWGNLAKNCSARFSPFQGSIRGRRRAHHRTWKSI